MKAKERQSAKIAELGETLVATGYLQLDKQATTTEFGHCLSVSNGGPGLPDGLHPGSSKRLGLRIIQALVRQINGRLQVGPGPGDQGACFKVFFPSTAAA